MATYHPSRELPGALHLRRRSAVSFDASNTAELATWLCRRAFRRLPTRSQHEYARLQRGPSLVIVYHSGSVLVQGANPEPALELLRSLAGNVGARA